MLNPEIVIAVACLKLNAYKLYPLDRQVREAYFSKNMLKFLAEQNLSTNIDQNELISHVLETNLPNKWKSIHSGGYAAGSMFIHLLAMKYEKKNVSIERAKYMFQEWNLKADKEALKEYKTRGTTRSLNTAWSDFKMVAHLWAVDILEMENDITIFSYPELVDDPKLGIINNPKLTTKQKFDLDSRLFIACVKNMERQYKNLNLNIDFWELPNFTVGYFFNTGKTEWNEQNKDIFSRYTYVRGL